MRSQSTHQQQHNNNHEDQPQATAWCITPVATVWPTRNGANQQQHDDDQDNGTYAHTIKLLKRCGQAATMSSTRCALVRLRRLGACDWRASRERPTLPSLSFDSDTHLVAAGERGCNTTIALHVFLRSIFQLRLRLPASFRCHTISAHTRRVDHVIAYCIGTTF